MATLLSAIETQARRHLVETTAAFWTSAELIDICNRGIKDLWGAVIDIHQEHHFTVDTTLVSLAADATQLAGVPADVFRVHLIEPLDTTSTGATRNLLFVPRDYNSDEFIYARTLGSVAPGNGGNIIYFCLTTAGAPVAAPVVLTAPKLSTALAAGTIRFAYVPVLADLAAGGTNPIAGESDMALVAWTVAYARAKEREDRSPDPNWLAVYATEKQAILTRMTPRQDMEAEHVRALFEDLW